MSDVPGLKLTYTAVPKIRTVAYLTATFPIPVNVGWTAERSVTVGVSIDGVHYGNLDVTPGKEEVVMVLGAGEGVEVGYELPKRSVEKKGLLGWKSEVVQWEREWWIRNYRAGAVDCVVRDQVAVGEEKLKVEILEPKGLSGENDKKEKGKEKEKEKEKGVDEVWLKDDGVVEWVCTIQPGEKRREKLVWMVAREGAEAQGDVVSLT